MQALQLTHNLFLQLPTFSNPHEKALVVKLTDSFKSHTIQVFQTTLPASSQPSFQSSYQPIFQPMFHPAFHSSFQAPPQPSNSFVPSSPLGPSDQQKHTSLWFGGYNIHNLSQPPFFSNKHHLINGYQLLNSIRYHQQQRALFEVSQSNHYTHLPHQPLSQHLMQLTERNSNNNKNESNSKVKEVQQEGSFILPMLLLLLCLLMVVINTGVNLMRVLPHRTHHSKHTSHFSRHSTRIHTTSNNNNQLSSKASGKEMNEKNREDSKMPHVINFNHQCKHHQVLHSPLASDSGSHATEALALNLKQASVVSRLRVHKLRTYVFLNLLASVFLTFISSLVLFESCHHLQLQRLHHHFQVLLDHSASTSERREDTRTYASVNKQTSAIGDADTRTLQNVEACENYLNELLELIVEDVTRTTRMGYNDYVAHGNEKTQLTVSKKTHQPLRKSNKRYVRTNTMKYGHSSNKKTKINRDVEGKKRNEKIENLYKKNIGGKKGSYESFGGNKNNHTKNDQKSFPLGNAVKDMNSKVGEMGEDERRRRRRWMEEEGWMKERKLMKERGWIGKASLDMSATPRRVKKIFRREVENSERLNYEHLILRGGLQARFLFRKIKKYFFVVKGNAQLNFEKLFLSFYQYYERFVFSILQQTWSSRWLALKSSAIRLKRLIAPSKQTQGILKYQNGKLRDFKTTDEKNESPKVRKKKKNVFVEKKSEKNKVAVTSGWSRSDEKDDNRGSADDGLNNHFIDHNFGDFHGMNAKIHENNKTKNEKEKKRFYYNVTFFQVEYVVEKIKYFQDDIFIR